jgi:hypothetical protein
MINNGSRYADAALIGQFLQPRGHIHRVAVAIFAFNDHIADMHAYSQVNAPIRRPTISLFHRLLDGRRTFDRIHNAAEFSQQPVAH